MIDSISIQRQQYAKFSKEDLSKKTVKELREIAPKLGISSLKREGKKVVVARARKEELIEVIHKACEVYNRPVVANDDIEDEPIYENIEQLYNDIAEKYYQGVFKDGRWELKGLKQYQIECLAEKVAVKPEFMVIVAKLASEIKKVVIEQTGNPVINASTAINYRSEISKRIEKMVLRDAHEFPENEFEKTFKLFYDSLKASFALYSTEKRERTNINLNKRQNEAIEIECRHLVEWAKDRLVNLPQDSARYTEVAIAIAVLTGRRQSEIMSSAKFSGTDSDSRLMFSGQLKKHKNEMTQAYEIPVLANGANAVLAGIEWLESRGKRELPEDESLESQQRSAKTAHDRFSRYLSTETKKVLEKYVVLPDNASWFLDGKDRKKFHLFRQIYAQIAVQKFFPTHGTGRKLKQILTEIMGHSDLESSKKSAAESYDSDIWVSDIDKIP